MAALIWETIPKELKSLNNFAFNPLNPKIKIKFSFVAPIHLP